MSSLKSTCGRRRAGRRRRRPGAPRVQQSTARRVRGGRCAHPEEGVREHPAADHHGGPLRGEVRRELPRAARDVPAALRPHHLGSGRGNTPQRVATPAPASARGGGTTGARHAQSPSPSPRALQVTPRSSSRTKPSSMAPIHWDEPTKEAGLSPRRTRSSWMSLRGGGEVGGGGLLRRGWGGEHVRVGKGGGRGACRWEGTGTEV